MQHGPLQLFHLFLNHGIALVRYSTKEEAAKAQSALNNCVLGNTTILADIPSDSEVQQYLHYGSTAGQQMSTNHLNWSLGGNNTNSSQNANGSTSGANYRNSGNSNNMAFGSSSGNSNQKMDVASSNAWNNASTNLTGLWSFSNTSGNNLWGAPSLGSHDRSTPLQNLLPGDLLGGEST